MKPLRCCLWLTWLTAVTAVVAAAPPEPTPPAAKADASVDAKAPPTVTVTVSPEPAAAAKSDDDKAAPAAAKSPAPATNKFRMPPPISRGTAAPVPIPPRFLQVRARIEALFAQRNSPPPTPDERANPFRPPGAVLAEPVAAPDGVLVPVSGNRDLTLLQQAVATLKVRGTVQRGKILQLVINSGPGKDGTYKEGDVVNVNLSPESVPLRVQEITRYSVTFRLNGVEMTLKF